jgi:hypothetical protein
MGYTAKISGTLCPIFPYGDGKRITYSNFPTKVLGSPMGSYG